MLCQKQLVCALCDISIIKIELYSFLKMRTILIAIYAAILIYTGIRIVNLLALPAHNAEFFKGLIFVCIGANLLTRCIVS